MLRFLDAGESHGPCLITIIEGLPAGIIVNEDNFNEDLRQRQMGYGRGERMKIETDKVEILSGISKGKTTGAPLALKIENKDWPNWKNKELPPITIPRPGHADLGGYLKYKYGDTRLAAERSSARETAIRVAIGTIAKIILGELDISVLGYSAEIGGIKSNSKIMPLKNLHKIVKDSPLRCIDKESEKAMKAIIDDAKAKGDTLGGVVEILVEGLPPGIGSYVHWDRKLDARIAFGLMSIQAIKGIEFGKGFELGRVTGSLAHDPIFLEGGRIYRKTNNAGGIEGGMSNGELIIIRAVMKPIPTLLSPLESVDIANIKKAPAPYQRSDICAVPAASIVAESVTAWEIVSSIVDQFGGDTIIDLKKRFNEYISSLDGLWVKPTLS